MPILHLLRHAKSSWDDPTLTDRGRPLNARGRADAEALAAHVQKIRLRPALVFCSPAVRTRQTLEAIAPVLGTTGTIFEEAIYDGDSDELIALLQSRGGDADAILLVGHNPALENLALDLLDPDQKGAAITLLREKYPTGTLSSFSCPKPLWRDLRPASCRMTGFLRPKDLRQN